MLRVGFASEGFPGVQSTNDLLRANVRELLDMRRMTQADLAKQLNVSQPWVSKRLSGTTPFQIGDIDAVADSFGLSPAQLLCVGHGTQDRRKAQHDRRCGEDRRRLKLPQWTAPDRRREDH